MVTQETVDSAVDVCSKSGWGCSAQTVLSALLRERDAYRQVAAAKATALCGNNCWYVECDHIKDIDDEAANLMEVL